MAKKPAPDRISRQEALAAYLGMGPERSLIALQAWLQQNGNGKQIPSPRTIATWSKEDGWVAAAEAHDATVGQTVSNVIAKAQGKLLAEELGISGIDVLREYMRIAFFNVVDFMQLQKDGSVRLDLSILERQPDLARAVSEIKVKTMQVLTDGPDGEPLPAQVQEMSIKFWSKLEALKQLGTHMGILKPPPSGEVVNNINVTTNTQNNVTVTQAELVATETAQLEAIFGELVQQFTAKTINHQPNAGRPAT